MILEVRDNLSRTTGAEGPIAEQNQTAPPVNSRRIETAVQRLRIQAAVQYAGFHLRQDDGSLRSIGERYAANMELEPQGDEGWVIRMRVLIKVPELAHEAIAGILECMDGELNNLQVITSGGGYIEFRRQQDKSGLVDTPVITAAFTDMLSQAARIHEQLTSDWD